MKTFRDIYDQAYQTKLLRGKNFSGPERGPDGHNTFTNIEFPDLQVLIDLPGNEWHMMDQGVVQVVGKLNDDSLHDILNGKVTGVMETEERDDERLARARIYEPDGGASSSSENTSSSAGTHN
jgi:hypothetical protein